MVYQVDESTDPAFFYIGFFDESTWIVDESTWLSTCSCDRLYNVVFITQLISGWWCNFTILKNDGILVNGKDDIPYMKWKIKFMFETTKQIYIYNFNTHIFEAI